LQATAKQKSSIKCGEFDFDLASLLILTKGQSWYNSLGYKQENYNSENNEWLILREMSFNKLDFTSLTYSSIKKGRKSWFDHGLEIFAMYNGMELNNDNFVDILSLAIETINSEFDVEEKIAICSSIIYLKIKNGELCRENEFIIIINYLYITLCSYFIHYTRYPLIKYII
jgi:hypothetical protein